MPGLPPTRSLLNFLVVLGVGGSGSSISGPVLALEADGLVDKQVSGDGVASGRDGKGNDNTL